MKLRSWILFGAGYYIGSRQESYQELRSKVSELMETPQVAAALSKVRGNLGLAQESVEELDTAAKSTTKRRKKAEVDVTDDAEDSSDDREAVS